MNEHNEKADRPEADGKAEERRIAAETAARKRKKILAITAPIAVVCIAFLIVLIRIIIPNGKYNSAVKRQLEALMNVSVGSTIKFGFYEQDNITFNGREEIEWKVLAVDGNRALIISQYALDCKPYNNTFTDTSWERCTLRTWLNGTFYDSAFGADHRKMIVSSTVAADKNPSYGTSPGNNTTDKVFLLSIKELNEYFDSDEARKCALTEYAKAQGADASRYYSVGGKATCWWWLRTPGKDSVGAVRIRYDGSFGPSGTNVDVSSGAVRPVMWIKLGS